MFFHKALQISAIIFFVGVGYKLLSWFIKSVGMGDEKIPASKRFFLGRSECCLDAVRFFLITVLGTLLRRTNSFSSISIQSFSLLLKYRWRFSMF